MVGDEESAREMCRDIEDRRSCGITAETLNEVEKENQATKGQYTPNRVGIRRLGERELPPQPGRWNQGSIYGGLQVIL